MHTKRTIIFAHSRSGSSSLWNALIKHKDLRLMLEPFHERREQPPIGGRNYKNSIRSLDDFDSVLSEIHTWCNGFKTLSYQLPKAYNEHLLHTLGKDDKIILLHRKNLLQAAVSVHISKQTNLWTGAQQTQRAIAEKGLVPIDIEGLSRSLRTLEEVGTYYKNFLDEHKKNYFELTYEQLYATSEKHRRMLVKDIFDFLELSLPGQGVLEHVYTLLAPHRKINNKDTYSAIPNLAEVTAQFEGERYGYIAE